MAGRLKRVVAIGGILVAGGVWVGTSVAASQVAERLNGVHRKTPYRPTPRGAELHARLVIADLHADSVLWGRDLNQRGSYGHVDVPRLVEGNVALQVFGVVTQTPRNMNTERNDDRTDDIRLLAMAQKWPPATWTSLKARAVYQARRLERAVQASNGKLTLIRSRGDLDRFLERRGSGRTVAAMIGLEGMHALEGKLESIDELFDAGFRMMAPAHFFDTALAGSAHGVEKGGLTELGRQAIRRMEAKGITLDLAHISPKAFDEALAIAKKPVVVSHTGVRGTCDNTRNLSDAQLSAVAKNGGVVGIGYWSTAVCGDDAAAIARAIRHAVSVAGIDHVGIGSDFDGAVSTPFDAAGLVELTDALLAAGFGEDELRKLMGGNALRVLRANLPE